MVNDFENLFQEVIDEATLKKRQREAVKVAEKQAAEREKFLRRRLIRPGPRTGSKGKKLKVSPTMGARGLFELL